MKFRLGLRMLAVIGLFANPAIASPLSPHAYTLYRVINIPLHGVYFVSQNTGEDLQNSNPPTGQFITKETWLRFRSNLDISRNDVRAFAFKRSRRVQPFAPTKLFDERIIIFQSYVYLG